MRPRFIKLSYFTWVIVPAGLWLTYASIGLPHAIWSYSWREDGRGMGFFSDRVYTRCSFVGPYGLFEKPAEGGDCAWVRFFRKEAN
jgi:hypothetical protein